MAPAPQWLTNDFFKDIIKRAIDHEISISDDEIIAYISKKRNNQIKSKTWITYVELKITEEPELKEIVRKHMETLLGVTDDEVKKLKEHNFETLTDMVNLFYGSFDSANLNPVGHDVSRARDVAVSSRDAARRQLAPGAVERVPQVHVVVQAPAEVLVKGRSLVEHVAHVRDAGGVPRANVLVKGRRGSVITPRRSAKQTRHVRHPAGRPRRDVAVCRLGAAAVVKPSRDGRSDGAVIHDVARELALRGLGRPGRGEARRGGQQRADDDARAPGQAPGGRAAFLRHGHSNSLRGCGSAVASLWRMRAGCPARLAGCALRNSAKSLL